jgi:hypothetical protein
MRTQTDRIGVRSASTSRRRSRRRGVRLLVTVLIMQSTLLCEAPVRLVRQSRTGGKYWKAAAGWQFGRSSLLGISPRCLRDENGRRHGRHIPRRHGSWLIGWASIRRVPDVPSCWLPSGRLSAQSRGGGRWPSRSLSTKIKGQEAAISRWTSRSASSATVPRASHIRTMEDLQSLRRL